MFQELNISIDNVDELRELLNKAFLTVAKTLDLTQENAPSNAAFISSQSILDSIKNKPINYYGLYQDKELVACYALEKKSDETYILERVAVTPSHRHQGLGRKILEDSLNRVKHLGAKKLKLGMINKNQKLKGWYIDFGYQVKTVKKFSHLPFDVAFMELNI